MFINVYKRLQTSKPTLAGKGPNYWKIPGKMAEGRSQGGRGTTYIYIYIYLAPPQKAEKKCQKKGPQICQKTL